MYSRSSELQFFAEKMCFFLNKIHSVFQATPLEKKIGCFEGGEQELFALVESSMHGSHYATINSIGSELFNDPFVKDAKWWEFAARYLMKYPFFREHYLSKLFAQVFDYSSKFFKFCSLLIVYSFAEKKELYSASFNRIAYDAKSLLNVPNLKYYTLKTITIVSEKFFLAVIFLSLSLTYFYGFSTITPLRVYEPTFFHSLMGSSAAVIFTLSLLYFFCVMQKEKIFWDMFFESSIKTDKRASLKLGAILMGCGTLLTISPLALSLTGSDLNKLIVEGKYASAAKTVKANYSSNQDKQSYLLSQIYFNAYNVTNNIDYKVKGMQEASKYLNSDNVKENTVWAVPNVVREMNDRLLGSDDTKYWYTTKNHESRKLSVLIMFLAGLFLFMVGSFGKLKQ